MRHNIKKKKGETAGGTTALTYVAANFTYVPLSCRHNQPSAMARFADVGFHAMD
jgi:hypothetical protein